MIKTVSICTLATKGGLRRISSLYWMRGNTVTKEEEEEEEGRAEPLQFAPCSVHFQPPACCWCLLTLSVSLGELFAVLVSVLAGDYAGRENKQLCHPSVHTNTLPGADCTVGKMTPKLCVMSRKRLETALAMLKIDISERGEKKKKEGKKGTLVIRQIVGEMSGLIFKGTFPSSNNSL